MRYNRKPGTRSYIYIYILSHFFPYHLMSHFYRPKDISKWGNSVGEDSLSCLNLGVSPITPRLYSSMSV